MNGLLNLSDGRKLEYLDNKISSLRAIVLHHGSPCEMHFWKSTIDYLTGLDIRAIAFSRPGYGESTPLPDRNLLQGNTDLAELLGHLGVTRFASVGWSAGGPPALASGLLKGCAKAVAVASPAPYNADDFDFFAGMSEGFAEECRATAAGIESAFSYKREHTEDLPKMSAEQILAAFAPRSSAPEFANTYQLIGTELRDTFIRGLTPDAMAFAEDDYSFMKPWGFNLEGISVPIEIWVGTNDYFIPVPHAEWLNNHSKVSTLHLLEGHDHISIWAEHKEQILENAIRALS